MTEPRKFSAPWQAVEYEESFCVLDAKGQQLAFVYYEDEPSRRFTMKRMTRDEARRIVVNIAKLPDLLQRLHAQKQD